MALSLLQSVNNSCSSTEIVQTSRWSKANVASERKRNTSPFTLCKVQLARSCFSSCETDNRLCSGRACIIVCVACSALAIHIEMLYSSYSALIYVRPRVSCLVKKVSWDGSNTGGISQPYETEESVISEGSRTFLGQRMDWMPQTDTVPRKLPTLRLPCPARGVRCLGRCDAERIPSSCQVLHDERVVCGADEEEGWM
ncbi:hypothetical protein IWW34DRAFT_250930 [Fusarium oxysporum f. sp. albedinis]|nr:hypothetical protein IWW34DRAFT_250930 [Fusarium oxysporum f. sp. albedinis]KAJ0145322.1 Uncharacterized protein HZ326_11979 [Fusarium oxysporum f. sp. albedinis]